MRYFIANYADGSCALVDAPFESLSDDMRLREVSREEALAFYRTAPAIDVISEGIVREFGD